MVYNSKRYKVDLAPHPRLVRAYEAALATDAVKAALPENQPDANPDAGP
jgi:maleylpyruvate isomerase